MSKYTIPDTKEDGIGNATSDLVPEFANQGFQERNRQHSSVLRPRLACKVNLYNERIILSQNGRDFVFQINGLSGEILQKLLLMMDGSKSLSELHIKTFWHPS